MWQDVLSLFLENYNHSKHSSTGYTPFELREAFLHDDKEILLKASQRLKQRAIKMIHKDNLPIIQVGDHVRITIEHTVAKEKRTLAYRKHFLQNWTKTIYAVTHISGGGEWHKPQYKLVDSLGNIVRHRFYRTDLLKIDIEKLVINTSKRPDFSSGDVFNRERHLGKLHKEGPQRDIVLPSKTQVEERKIEIGRIIKPRPRLIDELIRERGKKKPKKKQLKTTTKNMNMNKTTIEIGGEPSSTRCTSEPSVEESTRTSTQEPSAQESSRE